MSKTKKSKTPGKKPPRRKKGGDSFKTVVYALAIALFVRTFFVQAFRIPSGSMEDTLLIGDFLLVDKITYGARVPFTNWRLPGFREPRKGDIIVFKEWNANRDYIKRCVAVAGDTIEVKDNAVHIDGLAATEPYRTIKNVPLHGPVTRDYGPLRIPDGSIFMMGDNRNNSLDSRFSGDRFRKAHGPLGMNRVVGRAFIIYWSSDPPQWLRDMSDNWISGLLQIFVGRPRITRVGKWLATDYSDTYRLAGGAEQAAGGFGTAEAATQSGSGAAE